MREETPHPWLEQTIRRAAGQASVAELAAWLGHIKCASDNGRDPDAVGAPWARHVAIYREELTGRVRRAPHWDHEPVTSLERPRGDRAGPHR